MGLPTVILACSDAAEILGGNWVPSSKDGVPGVSGSSMRRGLGTSSLDPGA